MKILKNTEKNNKNSVFLGLDNEIIELYNKKKEKIMTEDRLWLTPEKELIPYECNEESFAEKIDTLKRNKQIINKLETKSPLTTQEVERCASIKASIGAVLLEDRNAREKMPPFADEFNEGHKAIISGFDAAQNELFYYLTARNFSGELKYPILESALLPYIYQKLVKDNDDMARKDKNGYRESDSIQLSFCQPTKSSEIINKVNQMFYEYVNCDVNWQDIEAQRPVNFSNIAKAHAQFVRIQPFMDGNKRMAYILTNGMLKLQGLSPIAICETKEESEKYMKALKNAIVNRDVTDLANYFIDCELMVQNEIIDSALVSATEKEILNDKVVCSSKSADDPVV